MSEMEYQVGQDVAILANPRSSGEMRFRFSKVAKVTQTQVTLDTGAKYSSRTGAELKSKVANYPCTELYDYQRAMELKAAQDRFNESQARVGQFLQYLNSLRRPDGNYYISQPHKQQLIQLINAI